MTATANTSSARDRLLTSAAHLFYEDGITATGVDRVVAEAGLSKPTLYAHFGSKRHLVQAVLEQQHAERRTHLARYRGARYGEQEGEQDEELTVEECIAAIFDDLDQRHRTDRPLGCAFIKAAAEQAPVDASVRDAVATHKCWMLELFLDLAVQARAAEPERLARQLMALFDGAAAAVITRGDLEATPATREAALALLRLAAAAPS